MHLGHLAHCSEELGLVGPVGLVVPAPLPAPGPAQQERCVVFERDCLPRHQAAWGQQRVGLEHSGELQESARSVVEMLALQAQQPSKLHPWERSWLRSAHQTRMQYVIGSATARKDMKE